jgi:hypothetical protein
MEHWWDVTCWGKTELLGETPCTALSTTNLTWTALGHNLNIRGKRLDTNRPSYGRPAAVFFFQNYPVLKYKSKDSLSLYRLWAISILQCGKSGERMGLHTTGNLPILRCSDRRNAGHSLQYLSTGQELYRCIGRQ